MEARTMEIELKRMVEGAGNYTRKPPGHERGGERVNRSALPRPQPEHLKIEQNAQKAQSEPMTPADKKALEEYLGEVKNHLALSGVELKFKFHESGELQVELVNAESDKVVRKIPPDELLELSASLREMAGAFLNRSV